ALTHCQWSTDATLAPPGKHTMSSYGDWVPCQPADGPWTADRRRAFVDDVFDTIAEHAPDVRDVVRDWMVLVPPDIEARFNITGGKIFPGALPLGRPSSSRPTPAFGPPRLPSENPLPPAGGPPPGASPPPPPPPPPPPHLPPSP